MREPTRPLLISDVEHVLDAPVVDTVDIDHRVALATDAGLLSTRVPGSLRRPPRRAGPEPGHTMSAMADGDALDAIAAQLEAPGPGSTAIEAIRAVVERTGRDVPWVRRLLDLGTAHLPEAMLQRLERQPGVVAHPTGYGVWLWVPDDPDDSAACDPPPAEVLAVQRYARSLGCDWVLFEADAPNVAGLPVFEWD